MALTAAIFDLDGTLIDTNSLHVEGWRRAFEKSGYRVPTDRIFVEVGKGGDHLVPDLLGEEVDKKDGKALRKAQPEEYMKLVDERGIRVFPQVRELLASLRQRGIKTALSTSSAKKALQKSAEVARLDLDELFDEVITADDIEQSKPSADAVAAALKKLNVAPPQAVMVGDTPYDVASSKKAGVVALAVRCGGFEAEPLRSAGARRIFRDPADLLEHLDDALMAASPAKQVLTQAAMDRLMEGALAAAREAMNAGEVPIGAVIATGEGEIIARGYNQLNRTQNKTAHAEIVAFALAAGAAVSPDRRDLILASTLEPCVMCFGAAMEAGIDTVLYGLRAPADGGVERVTPPKSPETQMPRIVGDILAAGSRQLLQEWLALPDRNPEQVKFVKQLLSLTD